MSDEWPRMDKESRKKRGKHGWAPSDAWNVDTYISRVLAEMIDHLRLHGHTGTPYGVEESVWQSALVEMSEGFRRWANHWDEDEPADWQAAYQDVRHSLKLLRRYFGDLWD